MLLVLLCGGRLRGRPPVHQLDSADNLQRTSRLSYSMYDQPFWEPYCLDE